VEIVGPRYLTRFRCRGGDCEDDCCSHWAIPVDAAHYHALEARMAGTAEDRAEFAAAVSPVTGAAHANRHALMVMRDGGRCAMLDDDRLCAIHRRYGEALLPDTCAVYPRTAGGVGPRVEVAAAISCPEVARLCLLADDGLEPVALDEAAVARGLLYKAIDARDPYERTFEPVRAALLRCLGERRLPLATRLLAVAVFAFETAPLVRREGAHSDTGALGAALDRLASAASLDELHRQLIAVDVQEPFAASVAAQVLLAHRPGAPPAFARLVDAVLGDAPDPAQLFAAHRRRRAALPAAAAARLEQIFHNYCVHFAYRDWYVRSSSLLAWTMGLLARVATLRLLVVAHPSLRDETTVDAAAVEAFYTLSRMLEHDETAIGRIVHALEAQGMQTPAHAVCLLEL
jgi:lysine-N-methylase